MTRVFGFFSQEDTKLKDTENFLRKLGYSPRTIFRCMANDIIPTREDVNGIMIKYRYEDFEVLLTDHGSMRDAVTDLHRISGPLRITSLGLRTTLFSFPHP